MERNNEKKKSTSFFKKSHLEKSKTLLSFESNLKNLENTLNKNKKNYLTYKDDLKKELNDSYKLYMENEDYEKALNVLKKLINQEPTNHEYFIFMGKIYIKLYDISSAISCFKKSILIKKIEDNSRTLETLMFTKGLIKIEDGKINKELLQQFKNETTKSHYYYLKSLSFLSLNNYNTAIKNLEKIIKIDPLHVEGIVLLGKILIMLGRYKEASFYLWKAHAIQPEHSEVVNFVAIMKTKMQECLRFSHQNILKNKIDHAMLWIIKGLSLYPNHPECLLLRSSLYRKFGKYAEALRDLSEANKHMDIDNNSEMVLKQMSITYNELSLYLMNKKNYTDALKILEEALKFNQNDLSIYLNKGDCLREMKIYDKAFEVYMHCLSLDRDNDEVKARLSIIFYKYAIINFNNKDYQECIKNLTSAIEKCNRSCDYYVLRARSYIRLKKLQNAYDDCIEALKLNPNHQDALEIKSSLSK